MRSALHVTSGSILTAISAAQKTAVISVCKLIGRYVSHDFQVSTNVKKYFLIVSLILLCGGCSSFMYGYTGSQSQNKFLFVDKESESFGYKRLGYVQTHYLGALDSFLLEKGAPDYIYEFKAGEKPSITLFYMNSNLAYTFTQDSWLRDSIRFVEARPFTEAETLRFK